MCRWLDCCAKSKDGLPEFAKRNSFIHCVLSVLPNWNLISFVACNFLSPQAQVHQHPSNISSHEWKYISHHCLPPPRKKIRKIRFTLNRFFMAGRNNAIWESLYMLFILPNTWHKALVFPVCVKHGIVRCWLNLALKVMAHVMATDIKGWRPIQPRTLFQKALVHLVCPWTMKHLYPWRNVFLLHIQSSSKRIPYTIYTVC